VVRGTELAASLRQRVAEAVAALAASTGRWPGLATILIGDDAASAVYAAAKRKACAAVGIESLHTHLHATASRAELLELIDRLNADDAVSGILC
jgi:methylenetetrahydrofolate dehydrogenase (NADP+)/methenyltetrahydrofolate cyclohydrolase